MSKYFKNVKSFEELKKEYKELLKANHPDNGGDVTKMQEINVEYDALFAIWKNLHETQTGETVKDTADSTRSRFYTECGWEGKNHDWSRSLKEVAVIVRQYVKEKYPTYKFSVRTSYASMCQELHVELKESPVEVYKTFEELTNDDKCDLMRKMRYNNLFNLTSWTNAELKKIFEQIWEEHGNFFKCLNEVTKAVIEDVDNFVNSYNFHDCDGMIDYFDVDFYYFGCAQNNGQNIKVVPKTARIKKAAEPKNAPEKNQKASTAKSAPEKIEKAQEPKTQEAPKASAEQIEEKKNLTFKITQGEDTRDGSLLWVVRIAETLSQSEYINVNNQIKKIGGYYSKFKHGFIFRFEPSEALKVVA